MAEPALDDIVPANNESESEYSSDFDICNSSSKDSTEDEPLGPCVRLQLPPNVRAFFDKRELDRVEEPIKCDSGLVEKVMSNYIIAKNILSHLEWRDKMLCKHVCSTWRSAVNTLAREQLNAVDFVYDLRPSLHRNVQTFIQSANFNTEPLAVLTFVNSNALVEAADCKLVSPCLCDPPCEDTSHCMIDVLQQRTCAPKGCMLTVMASLLTYSPIEEKTQVCTLNGPLTMTPFYCGVFIPNIPNVKFHVLNIRQRNKDDMDLQMDFYDKIDRISESQIIKGALVFVTEKYVLQSVDDLMMLNYLKEKQPETPYALGGCLVEETMFDEKETDTLISRINSKDDYVSENLISVGLFTVSKDTKDMGQRDKCHFEIYSLVITSADWTKQKIQESINEFASKVPRFEHSIALKLSCVGRDKKHLIEQDYFQDAFPMTPVYGCYGNGELGIEHPARDPVSDPPPYSNKRRRRATNAQGILYSYSTVFMYFGWGKMVS